MGIIKSLLYAILGKALYLRLVSWAFLLLYRAGLLRPFSKFQAHYFVRKLIKPGDKIIDIGANLGYYTTIFARETGNEGLVWGIEPVKLYRDILIKNTIKYGNIKVLPYALGSKKSDMKMGILSDKKYRHGLTRVIETNENIPKDETYTVEMRTPESLFNDVGRIDYIKCDIEGYEDKVIPGFSKLIERYKPIIQIELAKHNFNLLFNLLSGFGYTTFHLNKRKIELLTEWSGNSGDIFFIHREQFKKHSSLLNL